MRLEEISVEAFVKFCKEVQEYQNKYRVEVDSSSFISNRVGRFLIRTGAARYIDWDEESFQSLDLDSMRRLMSYSVRQSSRADFIAAVDEAVRFPMLPKDYILSESSFHLFYQALCEYSECFKDVVDFLSFGNERHIPIFDAKKGGLMHVFIHKIPFEYGYDSLSKLSRSKFGTFEEMIQEFASIWSVERTKSKSAKSRSTVQLMGDVLKLAESIREQVQNICVTLPHRDTERLEAGRAEAGVYLESAVRESCCDCLQLPVATEGETVCVPLRVSKDLYIHKEVSAVDASCSAQVLDAVDDDVVANCVVLNLPTQAATEFNVNVQSLAELAAEETHETVQYGDHTSKFLGESSNTVGDTIDTKLLTIADVLCSALSNCLLDDTTLRVDSIGLSNISFCDAVESLSVAFLPLVGCSDVAEYYEVSRNPATENVYLSSGVHAAPRQLVPIAVDDHASLKLMVANSLESAILTFYITDNTDFLSERSPVVVETYSESKILVNNLLVEARSVTDRADTDKVCFESDNNQVHSLVEKIDVEHQYEIVDIPIQDRSEFHIEQVSVLETSDAVRTVDDCDPAIMRDTHASFVFCLSVNKDVDSRVTCTLNDLVGMSSAEMLHITCGKIEFSLEGYSANVIAASKSYSFSLPDADTVCRNSIHEWSLCKSITEFVVGIEPEPPPLKSDLLWADTALELFIRCHVIFATLINNFVFAIVIGVFDYSYGIRIFVNTNEYLKRVGVMETWHTCVLKAASKKVVVCNEFKEGFMQLEYPKASDNPAAKVVDPRTGLRREK